MFNDSDLPKSSVESPDTDFHAGAQAPAAAPPARFGRLALCIATASALAFGVVGTVAYGVWFNHDQQAYAAAMVGARQALGTAATAAAGPASAQSTAPPRPATFAAAPPAAATVAAAATAEGMAAGMQATTAATAVTPGVPGTQGTAATAVTEAAAQTQPAAPDGEEGGKQASWSGPVTRPSTPTVDPTRMADATPAAAAVAASSTPTAHHAGPATTSAAQEFASGRSGRDARLAQQDRRFSSTARSRHKDSLFARLGSFFRRVSYRQHGTGSQQDLYSHP